MLTAPPTFAIVSQKKARSMRLFTGTNLLTLAGIFLALPVFARVNDCSYTWSGAVPQSSGSVTNQTIVTQSTVVTLTVPSGANQYIYTGDGAVICDNSNRCSISTVPSNVSETGWAKVTQGDKRTLPGSQTAIGIKSGAVSSTFHSFEWCKY